MAWIIGADEAGYGPNLGPLAVAATAWRVDSVDDPREVELYEFLADSVSRVAKHDRIAVADSKQLYKPGGGLRPLELPALAIHKEPPNRWGLLVEGLQADPEGRLVAVPWHAGFDPKLPLAAEADELRERAAALLQTCEQADTDPSVRARLVFPEEFNRLVDYYGTKGAALSHVTLALVRSLLQANPSSLRPTASGLTTLVVCDKHGGRNRYAPLLQHFFPDFWVETLHESRPESRYRLGSIEVVFRTKGESQLPVAWASLTAKYLRELSMKAFNDYWTSHVPGVRPTAGYPVDAKRFKQAIAKKQTELCIEEGVLWRNR